MPNFYNAQRNKYLSSSTGRKAKYKWARLTLGCLSLKKLFVLICPLASPYLTNQRHLLFDQSEILSRVSRPITRSTLPIQIRDFDLDRGPIRAPSISNH